MVVNIDERQNSLKASVVPFFDVKYGMIEQVAPKEWEHGFDTDSVHAYFIRINKLIADGDLDTALKLTDEKDFNLVFTDSEYRPYRQTEVYNCVNMIQLGIKEAISGTRFMGSGVADLYPSMLAIYGLTVDEDINDQLLRKKNFIPHTDDNVQRVNKEYEQLRSNLKPVEEQVRNICTKFVRTMKGDHFNFSSKLISHLNLPSDCEVYLTHDDTLFENGKNGFAVTSRGIYRIEIFEKKVRYISFEELARSDDIYVKDSKLVIDNKEILFPCGSDDLIDVARMFKCIAGYYRFANS